MMELPIRITFEEALRLAKLESGPVFQGSHGKWTGLEEMVLLTSMQHFGYGNWAKHADILTKNIDDKEFSEEEVCDHYVNTYMEGDIAEALKPLRTNFFKSSIQDHVKTKNYERLKSADVDTFKNVPPEFLQKIGYMPLRHDFMQDYEPNAEDLIYHMQLTNTDTYEKNVNLILLDCYRYKVEERIRMKKLIHQFRLVERYYATFGQSEEKAGNTFPGNNFPDNKR